MAATDSLRATVRKDSVAVPVTADASGAAVLGDVLEWDVRNWAKALRFWRQHSRLDLSGCRALEIGSRGGGLSLWLALQGAQVVCSDVAGPDDSAVRLHAKYGVSRLVTYERIDASHVPYEGAFDLVVFKSVLGAVGRHGNPLAQTHAVAEMHKALRPGGELYFAENLVGSPLHQLLRRRLVSWGRSWRYVTARELDEMLAPFSSTSVGTAGLLGTFGRTEGQRSALGRLDTLLFDTVAPAAWRYIAMGVARK